MEKRPVGSNFEAWIKAIKAKYPDAYERTAGEYGWSTLGCNDNGPTLTPHMSGPYWTDASSRAYSTQLLVGKFDHVANVGQLYAPL